MKKNGTYQVQVAQSVRPSEWNSSGRGFKFHSGQISTATSKYPSMMIAICINHSAANVITCTRFHLKQIWRLTNAIVEMKWEH